MDRASGNTQNCSRDIRSFSAYGSALPKKTFVGGVSDADFAFSSKPLWFGTPSIAVGDRSYRFFGQRPVLEWNTMAGKTSKKLSSEQREELLSALKARFEKNVSRHKGLQWDKVQARLEAKPEKLWSLHEMERTGGEPDVVSHDKKTGEYTFYDCSAESPKGRRSVCYDRQGQNANIKGRPDAKDNALDMAAVMGVELLTEEEYRRLQTLGEFDAKTSSWVQTPAEIRKLGGALFCDRRYDHVFVYHNGAQSYYSARGFRGLLRV